MKTKDAGIETADICRMNGWKRGTVLVGSQNGEQLRIRITAIGVSNILAMEIGRDSYESMWDLSCRNWKTENK